MVAEDGSGSDEEGNVNDFVAAPNQDPVLEGPIPEPVGNPSIDAAPSQHKALVSQEEFDQLEKANPLDAFDLLANEVLSSKNTGQSSSVFVEDPSQSSISHLFAEFQCKVLRADLFEAIEQDENLITEVKEMLSKMGDLPSGSKYQAFSKDLEPLLDTIGQGFHKDKAGKAQLKEQAVKCDQLIEEVSAFKTKLENFRQETPEVKQKIANIDSSIAKHLVEIQKLEDRKKQLQSREELMKQEAQIAIQKAKESMVSQQDLAILTESNQALENTLLGLKAQFQKLIFNFTI